MMSMKKDDTPGLFAAFADRPLADRLRPAALEEIVGQDHLLGEGGPIRLMADSGKLTSFVLWGPPGCGKTTLARILATRTSMHFVALSAVFSGMADLRKAFDEAAKRREYGQGTLLFVDEIHPVQPRPAGRLPAIRGKRNRHARGRHHGKPSFELNSALLSRCKVFVMHSLDAPALESIIERAESLLQRKLPLAPEARATLIELAGGDGRYLINLMESVFDLCKPDETLDTPALLKIVQQRAPVYDKDREGHYNLISALHKSLRGSDTDAALYWAARMLQGGEDPLYLLRRLTRFAMEDISLADPAALQMAIAAWDTYERLGLSGRRAGDRGTGHLPGLRPQIQQRLHRLGSGPEGGQGIRLPDASGAHPERSHQIDEGAGLRKKLRVRPRRAGRLFRAELLSGQNAPPPVLQAAGTGL